jgi:hypothetical protein
MTPEAEAGSAVCAAGGCWVTVAEDEDAPDPGIPGATAAPDSGPALAMLGWRSLPDLGLDSALLPCERLMTLPSWRLEMAAAH